MSNTKRLVLGLAVWVQRFWLAAVCIGLLVLVWALGAPAWAAPVPANHNQTVPRPTPTSDGNAVATATPRPDDHESHTVTGEDEVDSLPSSNPLEGLLAQPSADGAAALTANVAAATLNLREGPGTGFPVIGSASRGTTLTLLARNADGTWWYACCVPGTATQGWVSAELLEPIDFDRAQANDLLAVFGTAIEAAAAKPAAAAAPDRLPLMFQIGLMPPYAWQGQRAEMILAIANPNRVPIVNAELSDELPRALAVADVAAITGGKITQQRMPGGEALVVVEWPEIGPGKTVTATIAVTVTRTLSDGAVIDNLAAVRADNSTYTTGAITIGMPPQSLPDFQ
jgi:hypothetical protein